MQSSLFTFFFNISGLPLITLCLMSQTYELWVIIPPRQRSRGYIALRVSILPSVRPSVLPSVRSRVTFLFPEQNSETI